jgi:nucleoside-diphosphate-sugar epimerase
MEIRNVLITGGGGNIGEYAAKELREDYNITLFDRNTPDQHRNFPWETDLPFVVGDLTSLEDCMRAIAFAKADAIIHLGALPGPTELRRGRMQQNMPEDETMRSNTMGTFYIVDAARRLGVKKIVFASTFYTLGIGNRISGTPFKVEYLPIDEDHPLRPESTYGLSKVCGEEILKAFNLAYDIQAVALRLLGVDGRTVRSGGSRSPVSPQLRPEHADAPEGLIPGNFNVFQYVDVRDVAYACRLSIEAEGLDGFEAFYLSTDTNLEEDTRDVVERVYPSLRKMAVNLHGKESIISIKKAREKLGYEPKYSWRTDK